VGSQNCQDNRQFSRSYAGERDIRLETAAKLRLRLIESAGAVRGRGRPKAKRMGGGEQDINDLAQASKTLILDSLE